MKNVTTNMLTALALVLTSSTVFAVKASTTQKTCALSINHGPSMRQELNFNEFKSLENELKKTGFKYLLNGDHSFYNLYSITNGVWGLDVDSRKYRYITLAPEQELKIYNSIKARALAANQAKNIQSILVGTIGNKEVQTQSFDARVKEIENYISIQSDEETINLLTGLKNQVLESRNNLANDSSILTGDLLVSFSVHNNYIDDWAKKRLFKQLEKNKNTAVDKEFLKILASSSIQFLKLNQINESIDQVGNDLYNEMIHDLKSIKSHSKSLMDLAKIKPGYSNADSAEKISQQTLFDGAIFKILQNIKTIGIDCK